MTRFDKVLGATALALMFGAAAAVAQTPAPSTTAPAAAAKAPAAAAAKAAAPAGDATAKKGPARKVATTEAGKKCSADADAKSLHGKERRTFRRSCMKEFSAKKN